LLQLAAKVTIKIVEAQRSADQKPTGPVEKPKRMLWAVLAIRLLLLVVLAIKIIPFELLMMKKPSPRKRAQTCWPGTMRKRKVCHYATARFSYLTGPELN